MTNTTHFDWIYIVSVIAIVSLILLAMAIYKPWEITVNIKMDNNTLQAIKAINWSAMPK
jgi:hypothetical protein